MRKLSTVPEQTPHPSDQPGDVVEQGLLEVKALIEDAVVRHRDLVARGAVVTPVKPGEAVLSAEVARLIGGARHSLEVVLASDRPRAAEMYQALDGQLTGLDAGVAVRLLCAPEALDREFVRRQLEAGRSLDVRTAQIPWVEVILVDRQIAFSCSDPVAGSLRASVTRDTSVLRALHNLFAGVWRRAVPLDSQVDFGDWARAEFARRILDRLNAGVTDEVAARDLSVSVRTYRRYVADIMGQLGANSRFQAGARAAELGLLSAGRAPRPGAAPRLADGRRLRLGAVAAS
ncbi:LuxR family transcriptional regulator [Kitasatospora sp. NPDC101155]|uniref:LuxR family transcriptional regulator n=1 Tax=Kitasatospora sp. NPDC101155 TaxID=3364097 RepID=UPI0038158FBA